MFISRTVKAGLLALCLAGTVTTVSFAKDKGPKDDIQYVTPFSISYAVPKGAQLTTIEGGILSQYKDLGTFDDIARSANDRNADFIMLGDGQSRPREKKLAYYELTKTTPEATYAGLVIVSNRGSLDKLLSSINGEVSSPKLNNKELVDTLVGVLHYIVSQKDFSTADLLPSDFPEVLRHRASRPIVSAHRDSTFPLITIDMGFDLNPEASVPVPFAKMRMDFFINRKDMQVITLIAKAADFDKLVPTFDEMVQGAEPKKDESDGEAKISDNLKDKSERGARSVDKAETKNGSADDEALAKGDDKADVKDADKSEDSGKPDKDSKGDGGLGLAYAH